MSNLIPNVFTSYELSQGEEEAGQIFTLEQKMVLQNKLAMIAQDKINMPFTPNDIQSYLQREAEATGQMGIIQWLLDTSQITEDAIQARIKQQQETDSQQ
jgi:hypothetical protein